MINKNDKLWIQFRLGNLPLQTENLIQIFSLLDETPLPNPSRLEYCNSNNKWRSIAINSFSDKEIIDLLKSDNKKADELMFDNNDSDNHPFVYINRTHSPIIGVTIAVHFITDWTSNFVFNLFKSILMKINCGVGVCHFSNVHVSMLEKHFRGQKRTFYLPALNWLQYLGKEELERQGGMEALEANPLLKTERIHDGLLIQVGESPYDAFTPEGEELLVKATRSLPPVRK
ncbi:hypothetical protein [Xanthocytophaga flava]|uniref:hypothetical protein n=1 Tax=Xanthocytophaga flava TaxID=3048013 RepID=UPI0028D0EF51|nr:hypothetical protein [Xanthocytophaga flavus]MDJ1470979.1 hypothetical protein [Xanthocytophaga flavus]